MVSTAKRKLVQIGLCCAVVLFSSQAVRATTDMDTFCQGWSSSHSDPGDDVWCQSGFWSWTGGYDFTSYDFETALMHATFLCDDLTYSCWDTCESDDYKEYRAWWASTGECSYSPECFETWGTANCQQGTTGSFSCTCQGFNVCAPC